MRISRRLFLFSSTASAVVLLHGKAFPACALIQSQVDATNAEIQTIDIWVATKGPGYVSELQQNLKQLELQLASSTVASNKAEYEATLSLISVSTCLVLTILGVTGAVAAAPLFVVGLAISATLLVAKARYSVTEKDVITYTSMKGASDLNLALSAAQEDPLFVAYRGKLAGLEKTLGMLTLFFEFYQFLEGVSDAEAKKQKLAQIAKLLDGAQGEIKSLEVPGNLRSARLEALEKLKERLEANNVLCVDVPPKQ